MFSHLVICLLFTGMSENKFGEPGLFPDPDSVKHELFEHLLDPNDRLKLSQLLKKPDGIFFESNAAKQAEEDNEILQNLEELIKRSVEVEKEVQLTTAKLDGFVTSGKIPPFLLNYLKLTMETVDKTVKLFASQNIDKMYKKVKELQGQFLYSVLFLWIQPISNACLLIPLKSTKGLTWNR